MGDINQYHYVEQNRAKFRGHVLEVGSRDYGSTQNLRTLFSDREYVGIDMTEGKSVDLVLDLTRPFEEVDAALAGRRFGTVFCLSVLEHCSQPFVMADNITRLLEPDGVVCISVPFAWKFHGYPSDYWRFTHEGVKKLFPEIEFEPESACAVTDMTDDFRPVDEDLRRFRIAGSWHRKRGHYLRAVTADCLRLFGFMGAIRWLTRHRYLLPPTMIDMIGTRRACPQDRVAA